MNTCRVPRPTACPPRSPCASPRFAKPRARQGAVHLHCPPIVLRTCLRCDFALRSESKGCSGALPPRCAGSPSGRLAEPVLNSSPSSVFSLKKITLRSDVSWDPRPWRSQGGKASAQAAIGFKAHREIAAQARPQGDRGTVQVHGPLPSTRFIKAD
jgi:hypothetical protein